jgi:hypothetical protein
MRLLFFKKYKDKFADGYGVTTDENRAWEDNYRSRWQSEPYRVFRRLLILEGWSHDEALTPVFP